MTGADTGAATGADIVIQKLNARGKITKLRGGGGKQDVILQRPDACLAAGPLIGGEQQSSCKGPGLTGGPIQQRESVWSDGGANTGCPM